MPSFSRIEMLGSGRSWGERHRRRVLTAACASCLAIGVLIGELVGTQSVAGKPEGPTAHIADVQMLFGALVKLDRKLAKLIDHVRTDGVGGQGPEVGRIRTDKLRMVDQFFDQPVYGVKFNEVFRELDCLDTGLSAYRAIVAVSGGHITSRDDHFILDEFEAGKNCKQKLENDLHKANATGGTTIGTTIGTPTIGAGG